MSHTIPHGYLWGDCVFSVQNFPYQEDFPNSGARSVYIPQSDSIHNFQFHYGFPVKQNTKVYPINSDPIIINDPIHFTVDSKLFRGDSIGIKNNLILAEYTLQDFKNSKCGLIPISSVYKPSPLKTSRVKFGHDAQIQVGEYFKSLYPELTYTTNKSGSNSSDLILNVNGRLIKVEVKGSSNGLKSIHTLFDKSVKRGKLISPYLESVSEAYCNIFKIKKQESWFISLIDFFRDQNSTIGLAGDLGVVKSGKLPSEFMTTDENILNEIFKSIINHFRENDDHYFCILSRSTGKIDSFFVGEDESDNIFNFKSLNKLIYGGLQTYGGCSSGSTRIALKVKFQV